MSVTHPIRVKDGLWHMKIAQNSLRLPASVAADDVMDRVLAEWNSEDLPRPKWKVHDTHVIIYDWIQRKSKQSDAEEYLSIVEGAIVAAAAALRREHELQEAKKTARKQAQQAAVRQRMAAMPPKEVPIIIPRQHLAVISWERGMSGRLIGRNGTVLKSLERMLDCNLEYVKGNSLLAIYSHNEANVQRAKEYLEDLKVTPTFAAFSADVPLHATVPTGRRGLGPVCGRGGSIKHNIQGVTGTRLTFDKKNVAVRVHAVDQDRLNAGIELVRAACGHA